MIPLAKVITLRPSARIVLGTLCLLALATAASAKCAWVLWSNSTWVGGPDDWYVENSFGNRNACVKALDIEHRWMKGETGKVVARPSETLLTVTVKSQPGVAPSTEEHRCLPHTVDPRGPKGK